MPGLHHALRHRDVAAGLAMMAIGGGAIAIGSTYNLGSLVRMGPGFLPVILGSLLTVVGAAIAVAAVAAYAEGGIEISPRPSADWAGRLTLLAGPILFVAIARFGGLLPATFACVFVSALADRTSTWREAAILALGVAVFGAVLFSFVLKVSLPLVKFG